MFASLCFFFFKQRTAYEMRISDWSADVCCSDLPRAPSPGKWSLLEQGCQVSRIGREHLGSLGDRLGCFGQILEVHRSHRLAYPVASRHSRNGPANIIQRLKELGRNGTTGTQSGRERGRTSVYIQGVTGA